MDAISFVLGIKSSHLRSSHLRDLVYRGRVLRTSTINGDGSASKNGANGQVNGDGEIGENEQDTQGSTQGRNDPKTAWVMAVYEDDAGDEQTWKRTITNQGASEYRINNRNVTAQQYNEALENENILIKARNFLVFQGDVEAIASQSPRDLTRLIEQISGSLEFKADYEALKEAQEEAIENQNFELNRRRGINSEIKQYQEQKREADSYTKKADQKDQAVVTHILWKLYHFQKVMEESGAEIQKHQEELKEHKRGISKYEQHLEEAKKEQAKVGRDVGKVERMIKKKEKDVDEKENSLIPIAEKINLTNDHLKKAKARITEISKTRTNQFEAVKRRQKDLKAVEKAEALWAAEQQKLSEREGRALSEADLQEYNRLREDASRRSSGDQVKADNLARQQRADEETVNSLRSKVDSISHQMDKLTEEIQDINQHRDVVNELIAQTGKEIEDKKKNLNSLTSERLRVAQLRTELEEKLQEVLTKLYDAEDGRKQSEKETRLKGLIADLKRLYPGVKGRVGELCKPKQKKYGDAVSTALGRHFDAIIVDNQKTAEECIMYLKEQRRGINEFIPLETIFTTPIDSNLKGMHRGTRMAIDTIDFDKNVVRAMEFACGNAIVCDDLSIARYICYDKGVQAKAVTLDGTVIHKGGLMTGGRGRDQNRRRWDDTEVDNLKRLAEKLRAEFAATGDGRRNAMEEETLQGELTGLEQKLTYARDESKAHERNLASKQKELSYAQRESREVKPKYKEKLQELDELNTALKTFRDSVSVVEDEVFADFCVRLQYDNIRDYEAQQGSLQQENAQKKLEFRQQRKRLEFQLKSDEQQLLETESRVKALENRTGQDEALISELEAEKESTSDDLDTLRAELEQLGEQLEEQQGRYAKKAEKVSEQRREVQKRSKHVDGTVKAIAGLESEIHRNAADRYALLRRCKLEDITLPLEAESNGLEQLPIDGAVPADPDAMDIDGDPDSSSFQPVAVQDYGIQVDFDELDEDLKEVRCDLRR